MQDQAMLKLVNSSSVHCRSQIGHYACKQENGQIVRTGGGEMDLDMLLLTEKRGRRTPTRKGKRLEMDGKSPPRPPRFILSRMLRQQ